MTVSDEYSDNSRTTEALLEFGKLIPEALLTYAPLPKSARGVRALNPRIVKAARQMINTWLKNPKSIAGKSAKETSNVLAKAGL